MDKDKRISIRLREIREAKGLTRQDLADASGVSRAMVRDIEQGAKAPGWAKAVALADALGVSLDEFAREAPIPAKKSVRKKKGEE